jgi:hypothetical protein
LFPDLLRHKPYCHKCRTRISPDSIRHARKTERTELQGCITVFFGGGVGVVVALAFAGPVGHALGINTGFVGLVVFILVFVGFMKLLQWMIDTV